MEVEGTTHALFGADTSLLLDLPAGLLLANTLCLSLPRVSVLMALPPHAFNEKEEGQQLENPIIAKALGLAAARNLLLTPPLPFFSQHP